MILVSCMHMIRLEIIFTYELVQVLYLRPFTMHCILARYPRQWFILRDNYSLCPDLPCVLGVAQIPSIGLEELISALDGLKYPCCTPTQRFSTKRIHAGLISSRLHAFSCIGSRRPRVPSAAALMKALA
jgi:hypothetical protein